MSCLMLAPAELRLDHGLADLPELVAPGRSLSAMVASATSPPRARSPEPARASRAERRRRPRRARSGHTRHGASARGRRLPGHMRRRPARGPPGDQLEGGRPVAARRAQPAQERHASRRASRAATGGLALARPREELQHRRGDDAERAFGADEELLQVIAGVVLAQRAQAVPDPRRRAARLRGPARARAYCRSAAPRCRRHWSRDCRRSGSCPRRRGSGGRAGRLSAAASWTSARMQPASTVIV